MSKQRRMVFCKKFILLVLASLSLITDGFTQLKIYPLPQVAPAPTVKQKSTATARPKEFAPLSLPFWDDFSSAIVNQPGHIQSNYPIDSLWESYKSIWISNGIGLNPPSLNVATFNGLNSNHLPYSDQLLANGSRDTLTSRAIDLSGLIAAERNSVFLSFFYQ